MSAGSSGSHSVDPDLAGRNYTFAELGIEGLQPEIAERLPAIREVFERRKLPLEVVATQTWRGHSFYSLHHTGFAIDLSLRDVPRLEVAELVESLREVLGDEYRVLAFFEADPPHFHIEYRRGLRISEPVDDPWQDFSNYA